jgi:hypothetical protein
MHARSIDYLLDQTLLRERDRASRFVLVKLDSEELRKRAFASQIKIYDQPVAEQDCQHLPCA